jgi:hypothetical protein
VLVACRQRLSFSRSTRLGLTASLDLIPSLAIFSRLAVIPRVGSTWPWLVSGSWTLSYVL